MGTAHINIHPTVYDHIVTRDDVTVLTKSDFGDGTYLCLVSSSLLPEKYNGHMNVVLTFEDEDTILRFKRDMDT